MLGAKVAATVGGSSWCSVSTGERAREDSGERLCSQRDRPCISIAGSSARSLPDPDPRLGSSLGDRVIAAPQAARPSKSSVLALFLLGVWWCALQSRVTEH